MQHYHKPTRLKGYDYTQAGAYFVTLVAADRANRFGVILDGETHLNGVGQMVQREWQGLPSRFPGLEIDTCVIMPNHLHGLLFWEGANATQADHQGLHVDAGSLGAIIRAFKSSTTLRFHHIRNNRSELLWQLNYYDHILRDSDELDNIRTYILTNPTQWELDHENPDRKIK